ncbi:MAG: 5-formyltetrahydrofolate cyclo-ligase [Sphingomonadales bacterium]|nr:5-formyltetrahydrofolate cyclo-ligase [Sphingomonadales bacterium]NCP01254.1 5-formyltetrahydrofolate cyclo-ligase [Sphingomonadales bacterium]NCP26394.1 5-formyltetrahydrofolate cyclo-ligase [Sphingomonadales bacterium]NCP42911.1 5-formyltetrahydrofolate cyclo-ligase [Sphingomonadales bacterium]NCP49509.1 5-formyltetrahydrofolate cyclo-ligase [Sphingomonadales bacterium]
MSSLNDKKKKLREEYRRRRDAFHSQLDMATRGLAFRRPPTPLAKLIEQSEVIALYSAIGSEAPTARLADYLAEIGKTIAFPVCVGDAPLEFRKVDNIDLLEAGFRNISEPNADCPVVTPDLIIAPMLAFDRSMHRLGQGGGHYDRTFGKYPDAIRIGLAWSVQEADSIPVESHDRQLHMIITESEIIQSVEMTS